jgi:hypothetical protein
MRIRRESKKKECLKLHLCLDIELGIILEFTVTSWNKPDSKELDKLLQSIEDLTWLETRHVLREKTASWWF